MFNFRGVCFIWLAGLFGLPTNEQYPGVNFPDDDSVMLRNNVHKINLFVVQTFCCDQLIFKVLCKIENNVLEKDADPVDYLRNISQPASQWVVWPGESRGILCCVACVGYRVPASCGQSVSKIWPTHCIYISLFIFGGGGNGCVRNLLPQVSPKLDDFNCTDASMKSLKAEHQMSSMLSIYYEIYQLCDY